MQCECVRWLPCSCLLPQLSLVVAVVVVVVMVVVVAVVVVVVVMKTW